MAAIDPRLLNIGIEVLPEAIAFFKSAFAAKHPEAPEPTDAEVTAAYQAALTSSLAEDARLLAEAPPIDPTI